MVVPNPKLWSPDSPFLYNLTITISQERDAGRSESLPVTDNVQAYFGMRTVELGADKGTVLVFRQKFTLEDAIEFHAFAPLEASKRVTNSIHLGRSLLSPLLPVGTVNHVETLKAAERRSRFS
jgi:hypothetical protein